MGQKRKSPGSVLGGQVDDFRVVMINGIDPHIGEARLSESIKTQFRRHLVSGMILRLGPHEESQGYGFLEFDSHFAADKFRQEYNGKKFFWNTLPLQVSWARLELLEWHKNKEKEKEGKESTCNEKPAKPIWVINYPGGQFDGNHMLRVDGLAPWFVSLDLRGSIPWLFRRHVSDCFLVHEPNKFGTEGYGFIQFRSHAPAEVFLEKCNGSLIPGTKMHFQLSWATFSAHGDYDSLYNDEDDEPSEALSDVKHVLPYVPESGEITDLCSKGKEFDAEKVNVMEFLKRMNYSVISQVIIREAEEVCPTPPTALPDVFPSPWQRDGDDAKILFADSVNPGTEENLAQIFKEIGKCSVEIPAGKGCGTVRYESSDLAKIAMEKLQVSLFEEKNCSLSWGQSRIIQPMQDLNYDYKECIEYCCDYSCNPLRCRLIEVPLRPYSMEPYVFQSFFSKGRCSICGKVPSDDDEGVVALTAETTEEDSNVLSEKLDSNFLAEKMNEDYFKKVKLGKGFGAGSHKDLSSI